MDTHCVQLRLIRVVPAFLWMIGIFTLSSQSRLPHAFGIPSQFMAIAGHLVAFGVLAILTAWGIRVDFRRSSKSVLVAFALTVLYGVSDEIHQSFVPGRHATVEDVMTDAIGAAAGLSVMYILGRWRRERHSA